VRYATTSLLVCLLLVTFAFSSVSFAADPSADDVAVVGLGGGPGCWYEESLILMSNDSSEYDYKVQVSATAKNDDNGPVSCKGDCEEVLCQCSLSGIYTAKAEDDEEPKISCNFPTHCPDCDYSCDNESCDPVGHCTCVLGSYLVTHYRVHPNGQWYSMMSASWTDVTKEQKPDCPAGGGCS